MEKPVKIKEAYQRIAQMAMQLRQEENIPSSQKSADWLYWAMAQLEKTKEINPNL
jgi:hypothetical protein